MAYIIYKVSRPKLVFQSGSFDDYNAARGLYDRMRLAQGSTNNLWLINTKTPLLASFKKRHKRYKFTPMM